MKYTHNIIIVNSIQLRIIVNVDTLGKTYLYISNIHSLSHKYIVTILMNYI